MTHRTSWFLAALAAAAAGNAGAQVNRGAVVAQQPEAQTVPRGAATVAQGADVAQGATVAQAASAASVAEGAALMQRARAATDVAERNAAIQRAEEIYASVVAVDPKQGAALNNLAVLAANKGDAANAREYFERAIAADDSHRGVYALNYSKYLQDTDPPAAIQAARVAVVAAPDSALANEQLGSLLWRTNPADMLPFAHDLVQRGNTELATRFAMQCLQSRSRPAAERRAWLSLLASRIATEYAISDAVRESLAAELATLESDPEIGRGSAQLRAAMGSPPLSRADVDWWATQTGSAPPQTATGRAVMRSVLLAAGDYHESRNAQAAEQYFRTAIDLGDRGPDPDAFLKLVEHYVNLPSRDNEPPAEAKQKIAEIMNRYEAELFSEKSEAYARGEWPLIYRMHVALGTTYAYLGVWRSNSYFQNGIFQLSQAMVAANNATNGRDGPPTPLALPPAGVEKLAQGQIDLGRKDLALKARVDGAAALQTIGHVQDSRDVFATVPVADVPSLDRETRATYDRLRAALQ